MAADTRCTSGEAPSGPAISQPVATAATPSSGDTLLTYAGGTIFLKGVAMTLAEANALHPASFVPELMTAVADAGEAGQFAAAPHPATAPLALTPFDYVFA